MRKAVLAMAALCLAAFAPLTDVAGHAAEAPPREIEVYILAGQSNAVGFSRLDQPAHDGSGMNYRELLEELDYHTVVGFDNVYYYGVGDLPATASLPTLELTEVKMGQGVDPAHSGPEIGMAKVLFEEGKTAVIMKYAAGGTYLGDWEGINQSTKNFGGWASPSTRQEWTEQGLSVHKNCGLLYDRLFELLGKGVEKLRSEGYTPVLKGFAWMQGESDIERRDWAEAYEHNLTNLITDMRADAEKLFGEPARTVPFVIGKIAYDFGNRFWSFIDTVRAAEDAVAEKLENVYTVETLDLPIGGGNGSDDWHFNAEDIYTLGQRFAQTALDHLPEEQEPSPAEPEDPAQGGSEQESGCGSFLSAGSLALALAAGALLLKRRDA